MVDYKIKFYYNINKLQFMYFTILLQNHAKKETYKYQK